jgi:hypothetical protein
MRKSLNSMSVKLELLSSPPNQAFHLRFAPSKGLLGSTSSKGDALIGRKSDTLQALKNVASSGVRYLTGDNGFGSGRKWPILGPTGAGLHAL